MIDLPQNNVVNSRGLAYHPRMASSIIVGRRRSRGVAIKVVLLLALLLFVCLFPAQASAHVHSGPTLQLNVGFEDDSRVGYWTPVEITMSNNGANFSGTLSATSYTSPFLSGAVVGAIAPWSYQQPVSLPHGSQKQVTLFIPFFESPSVPRAIIATLSDTHGNIIVTQTQTPYSLRKDSLLIGILSDQTSGFDAPSAVTLPSPSRSIETATLDASTMPDMAEMLGNFDVIILDDFSTSRLRTGQLSALETWVNQGGALIEVGGPQWQRTLSTLPPQLLLVTLQGTSTLPAGTHLLPIGNPTIADTGLPPEPDTLNQRITISTGSISDGRQAALSHLETILASGTTPLLVQAHQGQGVIEYLAFDPATAPIANWSGAIALWKGLLFRALGDQFLIPDIAPTYSNGPGQFSERNGLFQVLQPETPLPIWGLIFLLFGYVLLIGPVRLLLVKRIKQPRWSWRIVLSSAVIFTLITYTFAFSERAASVNSISVIQLNQGTSWAHATTYFSVLIPGQGNFQVRIPGRSLTQPIPDSFFPNGLEGLTGDENATVVLRKNETDVNLLNIGAWTLHPIVSEEDEHLPGGVQADLSIQQGMLVGTVTNTLGSTLSDVYILLPHSFAFIGNLPAGDTQHVNIPLHTSALTAGTTLADQIASSNGLPSPYFPYTNNMQPQTAFQRHLAILSALSGEGTFFSLCSGPCSTHAIVTKHTIVTPLIGGPTASPIDGNDPLLINGAPATLIGWAGQPLDTMTGYLSPGQGSLPGGQVMTVNGLAPAGTQENLLQIPLNINFSAFAMSGARGAQFNLPPDLIPAQVVNAEGNDIQTTASDVYSMTAGSITFEFALPFSVVPRFIEGNSLHSMTISEPFISGVQVKCRDKGLRGGDVGALCLSVLLYNWSTNSWDSIAFNQNTFTTSDLNAYTSPDGRVLLQLANASSSIGRGSSPVLIFSKPALSLNMSSSSSYASHNALGSYITGTS
jgi:hypothetical protein